MIDFVNIPFQLFTIFLSRTLDMSMSDVIINVISHSQWTAGRGSQLARAAYHTTMSNGSGPRPS